MENEKTERLYSLAGAVQLLHRSPWALEPALMAIPPRLTLDGQPFWRQSDLMVIDQQCREAEAERVLGRPIAPEGTAAPAP